MSTANDIIDERIRNGTLDNDACIEELYTRTLNLTQDNELPTDLRDRGVEIMCTAINVELLVATSAGKPIVGVLQRALIGIGRLYQENTQRLAQDATHVKGAKGRARKEWGRQEGRKEGVQEVASE